MFHNDKRGIIENVNEDTFIIKPEIAIATIEVKSKFSKYTMINALENIEKVLEFNKKREVPILTGIISFEQATANFQKNVKSWIIEYFCNKRENNICEQIRHFADANDWPLKIRELHKHFPNFICDLTGCFRYLGLNKYYSPAYFLTSEKERISSFQKFYIELLSYISIYFSIEIENLQSYYNLQNGEEYRNDDPLGIGGTDESFNNEFEIMPVANTR